MPIRHVVVLDADTLSDLISLADEECDSLHDLAESTERPEDEAEREAHFDYLARAEAAQATISKALEALSHVKLLEAARDMLIDSEPGDRRRLNLVNSIDRFLTSQRPKEPDPA